MKTHERIMVGLTYIILTVTAIFFFGHLDLEYISTWGKSLLEHIHQGNIVDYATDLVNMNYGTNYNLFQNVNVALWCLIPYLISCITKITIPMVIYRTLIKIIIACLHVLCAKELYRVIIQLGLDKRKAILSALLYYTSPIVMIHGIGIGQIDCLGVLFFLISVRLYLEKKYVTMSFFIGMALLSKVFFIMFYVPFVLLNFDKIQQMLKYIVLSISVLLFDKILTSIFIKDYSLQATVHNNESFIPRLFHISVNYESIVIMLIFILCGICLMLGNRKIVKLHHFLLFPAVIFYVFFFFVFWHPQWIIYILPILLLMGCYIRNEGEYFLFYSGFTIGFTIHSMVNCNTAWFNAILISESLLGQYFCEKNFYIGNGLSDTISMYLGDMGYSILMAAFALLIILYYFNSSKKYSTDRLVLVSNTSWFIISIVPVSIYMIVLLVQNIF